MSPAAAVAEARHVTRTAHVCHGHVFHTMGRLFLVRQAVSLGAFTAPAAAACMPSHQQHTSACRGGPSGDSNLAFSPLRSHISPPLSPFSPLLFSPLLATCSRRLHIWQAPRCPAARLAAPPPRPATQLNPSPPPLLLRSFAPRVFCAHPLFTPSVHTFCSQVGGAAACSPDRQKALLQPTKASIFAPQRTSPVRSSPPRRAGCPHTRKVPSVGSTCATVYSHLSVHTSLHTVARRRTRPTAYAGRRSQRTRGCTRRRSATACARPTARRAAVRRAAAAWAASLAAGVNRGVKGKPAQHTIHTCGIVGAASAAAPACIAERRSRRSAPLARHERRIIRIISGPFCFMSSLRERATACTCISMSRSEFRRAPARVRPSPP